MQGNNIKNINY